MRLKPRQLLLTVNEIRERRPRREELAALVDATCHSLRHSCRSIPSPTGDTSWSTLVHGATSHVQADRLAAYFLNTHNQDRLGLEHVAKKWIPVLRTKTCIANNLEHAF